MTDTAQTGLEETAAPKAGSEFRDDTRRRDAARRSLPGPVLKELYVLKPGRAALSVLETFGVAAVAIACAVVWFHPWVIVPAMILIATRQQAMFVLAHDAAHYRLFPNRFWNDVVGRLCGTLVLIPMRVYRVTHRLHHNHLYEPQDPDIPLNGGYPRGKAYLWKKLAKDLLGGTAYKTYSYMFGAPMINDQVGDANRPLDDTAPDLRRQARQDRWLVIGVQAALPVAAFMTGFLIEYLLLWFVPLVTVQQPILRLRAICEHGAVTDFSSPLTAARTNLGPRWLLWLMFPHHVHYHVEHHMYPAIPHTNLPAAHKAMQEHGLLEGAEVRDIRETLRLVFADKAKPAAA